MIVWSYPAWHPLFETLGYAAGFSVYRASRARQGDPLPDEKRWVVIAAAAVGALVGSRVLGALEQVPRFGFHWRFLLMPGGKTIVGGLLGGWAAVELAKRLSGIHSRTGDLFALPLCVGIAVGRVGCFVAGIADDTYGKPTALPWSVDFGDGVLRHPVQLYEVAFLGMLGVAMWFAGKRPHRQGELFRWFLAAYLPWRLTVDFLKPQPLFSRLSIIQWACALGFVAIVATEWKASRMAKELGR